MTEPIDVLTSAGHPTGEIIDKDDAHRTGAWHRAAHLWIVTPDRRVLLQKRSEAKDNWPGKWDVSVAGHIGAGESAADAAVREALEEIGLEIDARELQHIGTLAEQAVLNGGTYFDNELQEIFLLRRDVRPDDLSIGDEVADVAFVTLDELTGYDLVPHPGEYALLRAVV